MNSYLNKEKDLLYSKLDVILENSYIVVYASHIFWRTINLKSRYNIEDQSWK